MITRLEITRFLLAVHRAEFTWLRVSDYHLSLKRGDTLVCLPHGCSKSDMCWRIGLIDAGRERA